MSPSGIGDLYVETLFTAHTIIDLVKSAGLLEAFIRNQNDIHAVLLVILLTLCMFW